MKLPTELRLRIYEFAFTDIIDDIESDAANKKRMWQETGEAAVLWPSLSKAKYPIFLGVVSFLHTGREMRR
jgi:hypothetical protein